MTGLRGVDVNLIVAMDAILSELNLTRAGERVGMSQSAMSGVLARLRRHFDDELLVRTGRSYELSPLAEVLRPLVADAMVEIGRTLETSRVFDPERSARGFYLSASDYALAVLTAPLLAVVREQAPRVELTFDPLPGSASQLPTQLVRRDLIIAGAGFGMPGRSRTLFEDRFVCLVDRANPRLRDGRLRLEDLTELPHVIGRVGSSASTPADLMLAGAGVTPTVVVTAPSLLALPFLVAGTDCVGLVPERLAVRCAAALGLVVAGTPLVTMPLVEAAHWHPANSTDPGVRWLLGVLVDVAADLGEMGVH